MSEGTLNDIVSREQHLGTHKHTNAHTFAAQLDVARRL